VGGIGPGRIALPLTTLEAGRGAVQAEGPESPAGRRLIKRLFLVSRLELAAFAVVIGLMVFKPGA
jgi:hypothetical protein